MFDYQHLGNVRTSISDGHIQWIPTFGLIDAIDLGAVFDEHPCDVVMPVLDGFAQRIRTKHETSEVDISAEVDQQLDNVSMALLRRGLQGRYSFVHIGPSFDQ